MGHIYHLGIRHHHRSTKYEIGIKCIFFSYIRIIYLLLFNFLYFVLYFIWTFVCAIRLCLFRLLITTFVLSPLPRYRTFHGGCQRTSIYEAYTNGPLRISNGALEHDALLFYSFKGPPYGHYLRGNI